MSASIGKRGLTVKRIIKNLEKLIMVLSSLADDRIRSIRTHCVMNKFDHDGTSTIAAYFALFTELFCMPG